MKYDQVPHPYRRIKVILKAFSKLSSDSIYLRDSCTLRVMNNAQYLNNSGGWCLGKHSFHLSVAKLVAVCIKIYLSLICLYSLFIFAAPKSYHYINENCYHIYKCQYARNSIISINALNVTTDYSHFCGAFTTFIC